MKRICHFLLLNLVYLSVLAQIPEPDFTELKCGRIPHTPLKSMHITERSSYHTYDLLYTAMHWDVDPTEHYIHGQIQYNFKVLANDITSIELDLHDSLTVDSITSNTQLLAFQHAQNLLTIQLSNRLNRNQVDSFTVFYQGSPPKTGSGAFETFMRDSVYPELWTLSEPYGAMEWWPCKQSLLDKIDSVDIYLSIPSAYKAATNGLIKSEEISGNRNESHWQHRYPIATYLVGIAVTNYVEFSEYFTFHNGDSMLLINRVFPEYEVQARQQAKNTPRIMQLFSELFMPYPFKNEWYGHAQFSRGGGMEHQTMSFMGDLGFELVAHEMAHQWFGDYVTLNSWHDIWLNEGFATYLSGIAYEHLWPQLWHRFKEVRLNSIVNKPDGSVYVVDTTDVNRVFNGRLTYFKGMYLLNMLRWELGDTVFYKALQSYLNDDRIKYGFTSQQILVEHLELAGDTSLTEFFNDWYYGEGYPTYRYQWYQKEDSLHFIIYQIASHKSVDFYEMHVPFKIIIGNDSINVKFFHTYSGQHFSMPMTDEVIEVQFDPELWLLAKSEEVASAVSSPDFGKDLVVYPTPANQTLWVENPQTSTYLPYLLLNLKGQVQQSGVLQSGENQINIENIEPGIYVLRVKKGDNSISKKIIIH